MDARPPALLSVMRNKRAHTVSGCAGTSVVDGSKRLSLLTFFGAVKESKLNKVFFPKLS